MKIECTFEWNDFSFCPTATYVKFFNKIKLLRPDIEFVFNDAVVARIQAEKEKRYFGHSSKFGPFYMVINNVYTNKYILVSYWDSIKDIFECDCNFSIRMMRDLITSSGVNIDDYTFNSVPYLNYTPFSYTVNTPQIEEEIDRLVSLNLEKTVPDKPRFRSFPNDAFRRYLLNDTRFDCLDKRVGQLMQREYMQELNTHKINLSVNGHAEICHRDIEILGLGNVLLRTTLRGKFHEPLIPGYHYIGVDIDDFTDHKTIADKLIDKYNEIKNDEPLLNFIGKNAREWYTCNGTSKANAEILTRLVDFDRLN
jgi:hypothetical protein